MENKKTLDYYENFTLSFIDRTWNQLIIDDIEKFLSYLKLGDNILDVGCGSGRDSLFFHKKGMTVISFDGSYNMAYQASLKISMPVLHLNVVDMWWINCFNGVWAMASLLHLNDADLVKVIEKCLNSLKQHGVFYASFKKGTGEYFDEHGRYFNLMTEEKMLTILKNFDYIKEVNVYSHQTNNQTKSQEIIQKNVKQDNECVYSKVPDTWISFLIIRK